MLLFLKFKLFEMMTKTMTFSEETKNTKNVIIKQNLRNLKLSQKLSHFQQIRKMQKM